MKRSKHNLSRYHLTGIRLGQLNPINCVEVLPGDTFQGSTSMLLRLQPMFSPVMHPCHVSVHHWFVPTRLVWDNWENFIVKLGFGATSLTVPTQPRRKVVTAPVGWDDLYGTYQDQLGVQRADPAQPDDPIVSLPFRALNLIFNEFYRDQQIQAALSVPTDDTTVTTMELPRVSWKKDRFTTLRPAPQLGAALTLGASPTALQVRNLLAVQRFRERRNLFGERYTEYLRYLGVTPSDARLQRPEFLGGGSSPIQFSEVLQTSEPTPGNPLGKMAGHAIAAVRSNSFRRFFSEHGYLFTVMFVRPINIYGHGIDRMWKKTIPDEYWQKETERLGQIDVRTRELYATGLAASDNAILGYQDRFDEYRHGVSRAAGPFTRQIAAAGSNVGEMEPWSFSRQFGSHPVLNPSLIECVPRETAFANQAAIATQVVVMAHHKLVARRLVSKTGTPGTEGSIG